MDISQLFLADVMTVLRYIACGCLIILQVFLSHCSGSTFTPVEWRAVLPLRHRDILIGTGIPGTFALVSRYNLVVAIVCRYIAGEMVQLDAF